MPPIPGIPNVVQFLVKHQWQSGHNTVNSYHFRSSNPGPYSVGDLGLVAAQVAAQWAAHVLGLLSNQIELVEVDAIDRSVADGNKAVNLDSNLGANADEPLAINTAMLYQWQETAHYRGGHPRIYIPGAVASWSTDGVSIIAGTKATLDAAMATFLTNVLGGGPYGAITPLTWVACHYRRGRAPLATPFASNNTPLAFSPTFATQRRRLRKAAHS